MKPRKHPIDRFVDCILTGMSTIGWLWREREAVGVTTSGESLRAEHLVAILATAPSLPVFIAGAQGPQPAKSVFIASVGGQTVLVFDHD